MVPVIPYAYTPARARFGNRTGTGTYGTGTGTYCTVLRYGTEPRPRACVRYRTL